MIRGSGGLSAIALYTLGMGTNSIHGETTDLHEGFGEARIAVRSKDYGGGYCWLERAHILT